MFYFDYTYLLFVVPAMLIALIAQIRVKTTFQKYSQVPNRTGFTGATVARRILDENGLQNIRIERVAGSLSDHYSPKEGVIRLSDSTYDSSSVAALGVAAHECGHAVQYAQGYFPIRMRNAIIPVTQIGSNLAMPLVLMGILFSFDFLINLGILLFCAVVVFQLLTLPVEFNASRRAIATLSGAEGGYPVLEGPELTGAKKVLSAAAMTYVGALIVALANLLRLLVIANSRRSRRN